MTILGVGAIPLIDWRDVGNTYSQGYLKGADTLIFDRSNCVHDMDASHCVNNTEISSSVNDFTSLMGKSPKVFCFFDGFKVKHLLSENAKQEILSGGYVGYCGYLYDALSHIKSLGIESIIINLCVGEYDGSDEYILHLKSRINIYKKVFPNSFIINYGYEPSFVHKKMSIEKYFQLYNIIKEYVWENGGKLALGDTIAGGIDSLHRKKITDVDYLSINIFAGQIPVSGNKIEEFKSLHDSMNKPVICPEVGIASLYGNMTYGNAFEIMFSTIDIFSPVYATYLSMDYRYLLPKWSEHRIGQWIPEVRSKFISTLANHSEITT